MQVGHPLQDMMSLRVCKDLNDGISEAIGKDTSIDTDDTAGRQERLTMGGSQESGALESGVMCAVPPGRGLWCENCNSRVVELKRQAVKAWMPFATRRGQIHYTVSPHIKGPLHGKCSH